MSRILVFIAILFTGHVAFSQDDDQLFDHQLDENKWQDLRDGIRYEGVENGPGRQWTYESNKEYNDAKKKYGSGNGNGGGQGGGGTGSGGSGSGSSNRPDQSSGSTYESPDYDPPSIDPPSFSGFGAIGYILLSILVLALIFLIYYLYINAPKKGKKVEGTIELEEVNPVEIPLTELQRLLQEALANKDYRGAVRIYFIFIIRDLAQKGWINWEKEKTNFHYLREMTGKNEFEDFNKSVSYFEIIWYGKRDLDASKFEQIKPNFTRFLDKLGVK